MMKKQWYPNLHHRTNMFDPAISQTMGGIPTGLSLCHASLRKSTW